MAKRSKKNTAVIAPPPVEAAPPPAPERDFAFESEPEVVEPEPAVGKFSDGYRAGLAAALAVAVDEHDSQSTAENGQVWANCARHIADGIHKLQGEA